MRVIGLDYGSKTIGIAMSDPLGWTAQPIETLTRNQESDLKPSLARLLELIKDNDVKVIVVGHPKNMNNTEGERVASTQYFIKRLKGVTDIPIELVDERLSTIAANRVLEEGGVKSRNRKEYIDKIAATFILQTYLDTISNTRKD